ncbi:MAG: cyclodeaminase/cyclohydrolase family protein [Planctomycetota bacterium]
MDTLAHLTTADLLDRLASKSPAPGGGAVAGLVGAQAAALARMVVSYSRGRKSLAQHEGELAELASQLDNARGIMLALADADAEAYSSLSALWSKRESEPQAFEAAVREAIRVPASVMAAASDLLRLCESLDPISNPNLRSDLVAAAVLAHAAAEAAALNVRVNAPQLADAAERERVLAACDERLADTVERRAAIRV